MRISLNAAMVVLVLTAGCGSDGGADRGSPGATLRVVETEFALDPASPELEEPGTVQVSVVNRGKAPHALAVETPDGLVKTGILEPGASGKLEVALDAGTYAWFCPVGDHRARGMEGRLTVGGGGASSGGGDQPQRGFGY